MLWIFGCYEINLLSFGGKFWVEFIVKKKLIGNDFIVCFLVVVI